MSRPIFVKAMTVLSVAILPIASFCADSSWNTGDGNWTAAGNWTAGVPGIGDTATLPTVVGPPSPITVTIDAPSTVDVLEINSATVSYVVTGGNVLTLDQGVMDIQSGSHTVSAFILSPVSLGVVGAGIGTSSLSVEDFLETTLSLNLSTLTIDFSNGGAVTGPTTSMDVTAARVILADFSDLDLGGTLTLDAGSTLELTGTGGTNTQEIILNGGSSHTINVANGVTFTQQGNVDGGVGLIKSGNGILVMDGAKDYSGGTTITGGTVRVNNNTSLGTGSLAFSGSGGTISTSAPTIFTQAVALNGPATVNALAGDLQWNGQVSGASLLTVSGGTLILTNTNTYSGGTTLAGANLTISSATSAGSGTINMFDALLTCTNAFTLANSIVTNSAGIISGNNITLSGPISGGGSLILDGGLITLSGTNSYSGGTTIRNGVTASGTTDSLQGAMTLQGTSTLILNQGFDGNQTMSLSGGGTTTFRKTGSGKTVISVGNSSGFTGPTEVQGGELGINGTLGGPVTISSGAIFSGNASVGDVTNNGKISAGNSIGTINIAGNYTQDPNATLVVEINDQGQSDLYAITGNANLNNGIVMVAPEPGVYLVGDTYTFLTASNLLGSSFGPLQEMVVQDFGLIYNRGGATESVQLLITASNAVPPTPVDEIPGNGGNVGGYLFPQNNFPMNNPDYITTISALTALSPDAFKKALLNLSPAQFGAIPLGNLNKDILFADPQVTLVEQKIWCDWCGKESPKENKECPVEENRTTIWGTMLGQWLKQDGIQEQYEFDDHTYGFNLGGGYLFSNQIFLSGASGYSHSRLDWEKNKGHTNTNSLYLSPSVGYSNRNYFVNFTTLFAINWHDVERHIAYGTIDRTATNHHRSYDLLFRLDGGYAFKIRDLQGKGGPLIFAPEARLSYLNVFEEGYTESGASSLNLKVDSKTSSYFQPELLMKILKEYLIKNACFVPMIKVGYVAKVPLSSATYRATLSEVDLEGHMSVKSFHWTSNQLMLGAGLAYKMMETLFADIDYEAHLFDKSQVHQAKLQIGWSF